MDYLKKLILRKLQKSGHEDLFPHIAWDVHEDPALQGADTGQIRT